MNKQELIERLLVLPKEIEAAEKQVLDMSRTVDEAGEQVADIERSAVLNGTITGKNETERKAQMAAHTAEAREAVTEAETWRDVSRAGYNKLMNEFRALQTVAQLLAGEDTL
jgi:hypothetical protein